MYTYTTSRALQEQRYLRRVAAPRPARASRTVFALRRRFPSLGKWGGHPPLVGRIRRAS